MELTKEYLDEKFSAIDKRFSSIESKMVTKDDLKEALRTQTKNLEDYTQDVAQSIIEAMDFRFNNVEQRLDNMEFLLKPIQSDIYRVKEELNLTEQPKPPSVQKLFLEALDKRGIKWYNR